MNLKNILIGIEGLKAKGNLDLDISNVECDYRKIKEDGLFIAIKGYEVDGHSFINKAIDNGAKAIIFEQGADYKEFINNKKDELNIPKNKKIILLEDCVI